jgi:hypothetical protein
MGFDVRNPGIFGAVFLLLRHMDQDVEAIEIRVTVYDRARLFGEDRIQLSNRTQEVSLQTILLRTEPDFRDIYTPGPTRHSQLAPDYHAASNDLGGHFALQRS